MYDHMRRNQRHMHTLCTRLDTELPYLLPLWKSTHNYKMSYRVPPLTYRRTPSSHKDRKGSFTTHPCRSCFRSYSLACNVRPYVISDCFNIETQVTNGTLKRPGTSMEPLMIDHAISSGKNLATYVSGIRVRFLRIKCFSKTIRIWYLFIRG